jgi:FkbM family methyltransferase
MVYVGLTDAEQQGVLDDLRRVYFSAVAHEQDVVRALRPLLRQARFFVDVGASLGQFTRLAAGVMKGGRVIAAEADPLRVAALRNGCSDWQRESSPRIDVVHAAVTDEDGTTRLSVTDTSVSGGLFRHPLDHLDAKAAQSVRWREVEVPARRLDSLCGEDAPDLVKIDVEGAELRVLRGATGLLARRASLFLIELHPWTDPRGQSSPQQVVAFMAARGYRALPFAGKTLFVGDVGRFRLLSLVGRSLLTRVRARLERG